MATCDTNALMAKASGLASLPTGMLRIVKLQLMREIIGGVQASPQTLLDRAACFSCLSPGLLRVLKLQLWCDILGGGSSIKPLAPVVTGCQKVGPFVFDKYQISWTNGVVVQTKTEVWLNVNGAGYALAATLGPTDTTYTSGGYVFNDVVCGKVRAANNSGFSNFSNECCITFN